MADESELTLMLLRHAKSDWESGAASDHQRPLAKRGRKSAPLIGQFLQNGAGVPQQVICSTALRARQSWELVAKELANPPEVVFNDALYATTAAAVITLLRDYQGSATRLLLVGHEPTWSMLVSELCGGGCVRMPTAALAAITFSCDRWQDLASGAGTLTGLVTPKQLQASLFS